MLTRASCFLRRIDNLAPAQQYGSGQQYGNGPPESQYGQAPRPDDYDAVPEIKVEF